MNQEDVSREAASMRSMLFGSGPTARPSSYPVEMQPGQQLALTTSGGTGGPPSGAARNDEGKPMTNILQGVPIQSLSAMVVSETAMVAPLDSSTGGSEAAASKTRGWSSRVYDYVYTSFDV